MREYGSHKLNCIAGQISMVKSTSTSSRLRQTIQPVDMPGVLPVVVLLFLGALGSYAVHDIPDRYDFGLNLQFDGHPEAATFKFFYTYDRDNQLLRMAVKVLSLGWVGIGFSRNAMMPDTDMAIGWVNNSGVGYLQVS